ncbi:aminopeptidase P N-terminal domain-containing protein [Vogesella oryzae]|uniref:aminopeptidase P N-terminal domain-containing protein n=1 Tax=Vogesella oryzae TaxID=1735285 RepID=UPI001582FC58|nr:aminopeptidase P N-terminal domain-containing protein [Vogesella oryzae]
MHPSLVERRRQLLAAIGDAVAILPTAPEAVRNADANYPYRADSHFLYLTGFTEPEAVLVLDGRRGKSILFCRGKNPELEIWEGFRHGPQAAAEAFAFDEAYAIEELDQRLPELLADVPALYWPLGRVAAWDARVAGWLEAVRARARFGVDAPAQFGDLLPLVDEMRLLKDEREQAILFRAGQVSAEAHVRAMQATRAGKYEYEIEAELLYHFVRNGARQPAYESIVAGGANACTLHYVANNARLNDGELLLVDAGCEFMGYAGDITRTFPVNGRFSQPQRDLYEVVLAAQLAAIAAVQPGATLDAPANAALRVLVQGMLDYKLLAGSVDGVIESGDYRRFYMHGIGHFLGLDVHDVGLRRPGGQWRQFAAGMCTTIEPGLYVRPDDSVPAAFHHIGIRIEDNVLVTANGHYVYTDAAPKRIDDIEALMQAS